MRLLLSLGLSAVLLICPAQAATYVVDQNSPAGDDGGPGSAAAPLRTIGAAARKAQAGDTVLIEAGVYREALRLKTSGTAAQPISFQAARPGQVVVCGADVIKGWQREPGKPAIYGAPWAHDFIVDKRKTGLDARIYGSKRPLAPVCCAEMFVSQRKPLRQVMRLADLAEGKFFVNWDTHRVYVLLPGGADPNQIGVEGCSRQTLFGPLGGKNDLQNARYIRVKGLTFRYAANWAQQGMVQAGFGWVLEDCVFEWCNAKAVTVRDEGRVVRCIAQDNGDIGFGGGGKNLVFKDCIARRNNWKGFNEGFEVGGGKWAGTENLLIDGMQSYNNVGEGIWLDGSNRHYRIVHCVCYGNQGRTAGSGIGICVEIGPGPGVISQNICYSNEHSGIDVEESADLLIEGNLLVDNGAGISLRALPDRECSLERVTVRNNRLKNWRIAAIATGIGHWTADSVRQRSLQFENNLYDAPQDKILVHWGKSDLKTLAEARQMLGTFRGDALGAIAFDRPLVPLQSIPALPPGISEAYQKAHAKLGDTVVVPIFGRSAFQQNAGTTTVLAYDLRNKWLDLEVPPELRAVLERQVPQWPGSEPIYVRVRVAALSGKPLKAVCLEVVAKP